MNKDLIQKIDRIHPYPAKFTVELAMEYIDKYSHAGDTIYDPFVGSGTSLLAASVLHRNGYGTDINHIGILISKAKLLVFTKAESLFLHKWIDSFDADYKNGCIAVEPYYYPSIDHWFCPNSIMVLSYILDKAKLAETAQERLFLQLAMSAVINTVSNQEGDTRYAAVEKPDLTIEKVGTVFSKKYRYLLALIEEMSEEDRWAERNIALLLDSKLCETVIEKESIDLIITSPPYVNTYDYYLYHKHRMNWLGYDVRFSMESEIGSRREFSSLKHNADKFSSDLSDVFAACDRTLKPDGKIVLVIGDGKVAGEMYDAKEHMIKICDPLGWKLADYSYSNLDETSRSFQKSYRTKGKKEHIMVFDKRAGL
ncbi:MAG: hypothetical protein IJV43_10140 [Oscillospiraceae bacterium]|nr:hypothetical protein [Oscillospiraceae bacterium]